NIGYADGSLLQLASNGQRDFLKEIGVIRDSGKEHLTGCLVFPIKDDQGRTLGLYGRSISPTSKTPHLYLKGNHKGIFNRKTSKVYDEIILTECIIDCLSLVQLGIENVQAIYGTGGFTPEHLETLRADRVKTIIIALDNDKPGREASEKYKAQLLDEGFQVKVIFPAGAKDWNEYLLQKGTKAEVLKQIEEAELLKAEPKEPSEFEARKEGQKYLFTIKGLCYRLLGVKPAFVSSLRVNIRAEFEERNFLDNVDLYSARSRSVFSQNLAQLFGMEASRIEKDLLQIVEHLEEERDKALMEFADKPVTMTDDDKALGLELLQDPNLFDRILEDTETLG
ncbi:MAG: toprim domain-containing protein, partial [Deltaproteobacteria bacterium]|nr:toprim domain-containing protein [Deltaproteobacteria bacterium]